jgi:hypothetical protein
MSVLADRFAKESPCVGVSGGLCAQLLQRTFTKYLVNQVALLLTKNVYQSPRTFTTEATL